MVRVGVYIRVMAMIMAIAMVVARSSLPGRMGALS